MFASFLRLLARSSRLFLCAGRSLAGGSRGDALLRPSTVRLLGARRTLRVRTPASLDAGTARAPTAAIGRSGCARSGELCVCDGTRDDRGERSADANTNEPE